MIMRGQLPPHFDCHTTTVPGQNLYGTVSFLMIFLFVVANCNK